MQNYLSKTLLNKTQNNNSQISKFFFLFSVIFLFSYNLFANDIRNKPIIDKLWIKISENDKKIFNDIIFLTNSEKYDDAIKKVDQLYKNKENKNEEHNPFQVSRKDLKDTIRNIILWQKYSSAEILKSLKEKDSKNFSFNDISRFVEDNKFYPNIKELRYRAETAASISKIPYRLSEQYFKSNPPNSLESRIYLIDAKSDFINSFKGSQDDKTQFLKEIQDLITDSWINGNFSEEQEKKFLDKYSNKLTIDDHVSKINRLIWDQEFKSAKRILNLVDEEHQKLFNAIIEIRLLPSYIDNIILSVSRKYRNDENLTYSRILWLKQKDKLEEIIELFSNLEETKYPEKWWTIRRLYSREMIKQKKYKEAYQIISKHQLKTSSSNFWEAEWMAGWISLRFLNKPNEAYIHFDNLYKNVTQAVTISRGAYWLGMTSLAMNDKTKAIDWYRVAAKYPLYFYGQLAIHKTRQLDSINSSQDIILPKDPEITVGDARKIASSNAVKVAYILSLMDKKTESTKIFEYAVTQAETPGQIAVIMRIVNELGDRETDVRISRTAAKKNVFFIKDKFQIVKEVEKNEFAPLVHAIIKQESGFAPSAVSSVGAIGFMQIMPETAKLVAKDLGVKYDRKKLATDIEYNVELGSFYIKQLIDKFDGSEILAIASYNAGPNAASRWIKEFYDPRDQKDIDKVVDWIELITYSETRNYVQRIMENLIVYKYLMSRHDSQNNYLENQENKNITQENNNKQN